MGRRLSNTGTETVRCRNRCCANSGTVVAASAVITRNAYGTLVMNARYLMFVDIDHVDAPTSGPGLVSSRPVAFRQAQTDARSAACH
jgi:hypothetical protein